MTRKPRIADYFAGAAEAGEAAIRATIDGFGLKDRDYASALLLGGAAMLIAKALVAENSDPRLAECINAAWAEDAVPWRLVRLS